jgi:diguanylate cyclase (GGDEF)-like protein
MKILIVEDDELTAQALSTVLSAHHYAVEIAQNGRSGLALLDSFEYDLLILDVGLPDLDGIEVCRQVRTAIQTPERAQLPILLLTAHDSHHDRALGLDAGADDYVVKPFDEEELVARIRALLRRATAIATPLLEWGDLQLNPSACEVVYGAIPVACTPKEYGLLELLLRNNRRVFSCASILEHLWAYEDVPGEEAVRTHIKGLRQKLKAVGAPSDVVETVYGIGYRLKPLSAAAINLSPTPKSPEQELRAKLSAVWHRCKDRISEQIFIIEQAAGNLDLATQQPAAQQAHTLAGSLGTFGFTEGSRLAKEMEHLLAERPVKPKALKQLQELTAKLRQVIDIPSTGTNPISPAPQVSFAEPARIQPLILVVSVDRDWIASLEKEFPLWNYHLASASTPKAIDKICQNDSPKMVILDLECFESLEIGMKLLSTFQLHNPPIPVIVLTTHSDLTERLAVSRYGGRLLLQKSTPIAQILEAATQAIHKLSLHQAKILVVDDDITLLDALTTLLKPWGFNVFTLSDPQRLWETLELVAPDILLLDIEFPNLSGIELCRVVRSDLQWGHLPVIVLTAHTETETIAQAFGAGADDFISKPIIGAELVARILSRLERVKLLRQLIESDPLTGVANRHKSTQDLNTFLQSADRSHQPVAIAIIDMDRLRDINVQYGHATGDAILRQFGHLLRQFFCQEDVVARWGGEEFVVGMYGMTREDGVQRLLQVLDILNKQGMSNESGWPVSVTFSAGVAQYPLDGADLQALYCAADQALRQAKKLREKTNRHHNISSILPAETAVVANS